VFAGYSGVFGNIILVRAGNVVWNLAHHAHLNGRSAGQAVDEGEYLAPMGATGLVSGRHVHTERRVGGADAIQSGTHTNPRNFYTAAAGGSSTPFKPKEWDEMATKDEIKDAFRDVLTEREKRREATTQPVSLVPLTEGGVFLVSAVTGRRVHVENRYHLGILRRVIGNRSDDTMLAGELDIFQGYIDKLNGVAPVPPAV